jgi:hypothetical protein
MHAKPFLAADPDRPAQAIEGEAAGEVVRGFALAVDQHVVAFGPEDEIEQRLALGAEQARPERPVRRQHVEVVGHQALEEAADILARQPEQRAVDEGGPGHGHQLGSGQHKGKAVSEKSRIEIRKPDDWHVHLRDGEMLKAVAGHTARQFARAIVMPNLVPPVTTSPPPRPIAAASSTPCPRRAASRR